MASLAQAESSVSETSVDVPHSSKSAIATGVQVNTSPSGVSNRFGFKSVKDNYYNLPMDFGFNIMPIQKFGVLGIGALLKTNSTRADFASRGDRANLVFAWAYGAEVTYQARYSDSQIIVPVVGYSAEQWRYQLRGVDQKRGFLNARGPMAGLMFCLNSLDDTTARSLNGQMGITRTYLVAEYRNVRGATRSNDANKGSLNGDTLSMGLRFEL